MSRFELDTQSEKNYFHTCGNLEKWIGSLLMETLRILKEKENMKWCRTTDGIWIDSEKKHTSRLVDEEHSTFLNFCQNFIYMLDNFSECVEA